MPTLAAAFVPSFEFLLLCRFLQGLLIPAFFTSVLGYIAEEWEPSQRGRITGVNVTATAASGFAGRFVAGAYAELGGWRLSFLALGIVTLAGALLVWWTMAPSRNFVPNVLSASVLSGFALNLRNRALLYACAVGFATMFSFLGLFTYVSFYLSKPPFELSPSALGALFLTYLLAATTTPSAGGLIDRFGPKRVLIWASSVATAGIAATGVPSLPVILVGLVACCAGVFTSHSACIIYTASVAVSGRLAAAGLYLTFYYAGAALGAWLPGMAYLSAGWAGCVALLFVVQVSATLTAALTWRGQRRTDDGT